MSDTSAPGGADSENTSGERLQKVLASRGFGSRRVCEEMIRDGRVSVNGEVAVLGRRVDTASDVVSVDGAPVGVRPDFVYYLLNKPRGVVSTAKDTHARDTVVSFVPSSPRVFPVGRLDADSEGLMILTNDGDFANRLMHPRYSCEKEYLVMVESGPDGVSSGNIRRLREGIELEEGRTAPAKVSQPEPGVLRMTISEGKKRQIRRMCLLIGHPVKRLIRVRIGVVADARLAPGEHRQLTQDEVLRLAGAHPRGQRYP